MRKAASLYDNSELTLRRSSKRGLPIFIPPRDSLMCAGDGRIRLRETGKVNSRLAWRAVTAWSLCPSTILSPALIVER